VKRLLTALITHWVYEYRPGFWGQLSQYWRLDVELAAGMALSLLAFYILFASNIPGKKIDPGIYLTAFISLFIFTGAVVASFLITSPEASSIGARLFCEVEVLIYGGLSLGGFLFLTRRGLLVSDWPINLLLGISAGLIPALIMQLACMYDPRHALIYHFGPVVLLGLVGWGLSSKMRTYMDQKTKILFRHSPERR
jgi:hypothetical protein